MTKILAKNPIKGGIPAIEKIETDKVIIIKLLNLKWPSEYKDWLFLLWIESNDQNKTTNERL